MSKKYEGIWSPMPTPLDTTGHIDAKRIPELVEYLVGGGVDGLFPLGTSGEFAFLSRDERRTMIKHVVDAANGRVPVAAGVSDTSIDSVIQYAKEAEDLGADAVVTTTPYYFATGDKGIHNFITAIVGRINLPLILYNIPDYTRNPVSVQLLNELSEEHLIVGMKYTENNLSKLIQYLASCGKTISILNGTFALTYSCLSFGGAGSVISVANITPKKASSIYDDFRAGRLESAAKTQLELMQIDQILSVGSFPAAMKYAMSLVGQPVGGTKPPIPDLSDSEKSIVRGMLENYQKHESK